ncbi:hypothetical protein SAMN03080610_03144 [Afifella marina DSM 2698]|uniref:DUF6538 domain-containing protein n=2 Tax=Afifella marina TaxID=1080 RepID=A0A1G5P2U5_AFIMA|nr:hypothetical protein SAMN03080610_03144 [Afifella marina DSM 2698]
MGRTSYLLRRGGRYYLQVRAAKCAAPLLGKTLLRTSLQTSDFRTARRRLHQCLPWVFSMNDSINYGDLFARNLREIRNYLSQSVLDEDALFARHAFEEMLKNLNRRAEAQGAHPAVVAPDYFMLFQQFVQQNVRAESTLRERGLAEAYERGRTDARGDTPPPPMKRDEVSPAPSAASSSSLRRVRISEALEMFLEHSRETKGDDRARSHVGLIVQFLIDTLGDPILADVSLDELKEIDRMLPDIPNRKGLPPAAKKSLATRYAYARERGWKGLERLTEARLRNGYHASLSQFFGWAISANVFPKPKPIFHCVSKENLASLPRDAFEDDELLKIVRMPLFTGCYSETWIWTPGDYFIQNHLYWGYLILFLSGMRPGEVGQLRVSDIVKRGDHYYFDLRPFDPRKGRVPLKEARRFKTESSARVIPIHPLLIELGLMDRVADLARVGSVRLFPEWAPYQKKTGEVRWGQPITKSWQYLKGRLDLGRADVTLYSTRHWMAEALDETNTPSRTRNRIMGHTDKNDMPGRYGRKSRLGTKQTELVTSAADDLIKKMGPILLAPKQRADKGELTKLKPWLKKANWAKLPPNAK